MTFKYRVLIARPLLHESDRPTSCSSSELCSRCRLRELHKLRMLALDELLELRELMIHQDEL